MYKVCVKFFSFSFFFCQFLVFFVFFVLLEFKFFESSIFSNRQFFESSIFRFFVLSIFRLRIVNFSFFCVNFDFLCVNLIDPFFKQQLPICGAHSPAATPAAAQPSRAHSTDPTAHISHGKAIARAQTNRHRQVPDDDARDEPPGGQLVPRVLFVE